MIVKSIPMLDAAAEDAAKKWIFNPAKAAGKPVAVWVAVSVKFPPN
jgi:outer membrane biosynthesis protein TonB